jgi:hypothetical protein
VIRALLRLGERRSPLDLQGFVARHYTKLRGQTQLLVDAYIRQGRQQRLPTTALEQLRWLLGA